MPADHHPVALRPDQVRCFVLTVSDTRTMETDTSGRAIAALLDNRGYILLDRKIVKDEPVQVAAAVRAVIDREAADAVITTGGTGLAGRDSTYEALSALFEKRIDGFGELFRMLSFHEIGPAAMLSRACAGTIGGCAVFLLPGSENAVRLATERLIAPELDHIVSELRKH